MARHRQYFRASNVIDVHIVSHSGDRIDWLADCLDSLNNEPINIHHTARVEGDIRRARLNGYLKGTSPYVSFVDPDDVVVPGCYVQLLNALEEDSTLCGAYGLSDTMDVDGNRLGLIHPYREYSRNQLRHCVQEIHQPFIVRRADVLTVFKYHYDIIPPVAYTDVVIFNLLALYKPWKAIDSVGYVWRIHADGSHNRPMAEKAVAVQMWETINNEPGVTNGN